MHNVYRYASTILNVHQPITFRRVLIINQSRSPPRLAAFFITPDMPTFLRENTHYFWTETRAVHP